MKIHVWAPPNGELIGADLCATMPCGCSIEIDGDGLLIVTCADREHQTAHLETARAMRFGGQLGRVEVES